MEHQDAAEPRGAEDAKKDRRSRRTRQLLGHALVELMLEKRYDSITVQDIIDRADVGRSTFYAHYRDKEDLFVQEFESLLADLSHQVERESPGSGPLVPSLGLFRHVQEHHHLYRALVRGRGLEVIEKAAQDYLSRSVEDRLEALTIGGPEPLVPRPVLAIYLAGSLRTLLKWWLDNDMPHTPERMDEFYQRLVGPGVRAALGRNPGQTSAAGASRGRGTSQKAGSQPWDGSQGASGRRSDGA